MIFIYYYLQQKHLNYNKTCNICFHPTNSTTIHQIQLVTSGLGDHSTENQKEQNFTYTMCQWIHMWIQGYTEV